MVNMQRQPLLSIHLDGPAIVDGRILVDDLMVFVSNLGTALERVVNVLEGGVGVRPGRPPRAIQLLSQLEIVAVGRGSFTVDLDLRREKDYLPNFDIGEIAVEKLVSGLPSIFEDMPLPEGFDEGVLTALREAGRVFDKGIETADLYLVREPDRPRTVFSTETRDKVVSRIRRFQQSWVSVEGRLLMADVQETTLRCRLHTSLGQRIYCTFPEYLAPTIMSLMRKFVSVRGEATIERGTDQVKSIKVLDIEPIDEPSPGMPIVPSSFWETKSFDDLAEEQGVYPVDDLKRLEGDWPESTDFDSFLEAIRSVRANNAT